MGQRFDKMRPDHIAFIEHQQLFFVGTAANDGTINVSPKGWDSLRILGPNRIAWLNITGSGNETAAHLAQNERMTMMFCAFDGNPKILRLYGKAVASHPRDEHWDELAKLFKPHKSARQYVDFKIDLVQTSCGFGVPFYDFTGERDNMDRWLAPKDDKDIVDYWREKNQLTVDGQPTHIIEED